MPNRTVKYRKLRKSTVGDMRTCITLEDRSITAPSFDSTSFTQDYNIIRDVWCKVETMSEQRTFDGINIDDIATHEFTIRFRDDVTSETRIRYKNTLYRIKKIENLEERDEYLVIKCRKDGEDDKEAAQ